MKNNMEHQRPTVMPKGLQNLVCVFAGVLFAVAATPSRAQVRGVGAAPAPAGACCQVVGVNLQTGVVTAKVDASGQQFEFRSSNPALLRSLRPGQSVFANFLARQVSLDGRTACCAIVAMAPPGTAAGSSAPTAPADQQSPAASVGIAPPAARPTGAGAGNAPCGAGEVPGLAGPIRPSGSALAPLSAINELQQIAWTNFAKQSVCDAVSQLMTQVNQVTAPDKGCDSLLECWSFGTVIQDVRPEIDIAAAPGVRYACLSPQDCPAGTAPGFAVEVPLAGPGWKFSVGARVGYNIHVEQDYKNPVNGDVHKVKDLLNCGFSKEMDVTLADLRITEATRFNQPADPSRPTVAQAAAQVHMVLTLGGAVSTNGPQQLNLTAVVNQSGQIIFSNPAPLSANVKMLDVCGVAELPARLDELALNLAWDPGKRQIDGAISGKIVLELAQILGKTLAVSTRIKASHTLPVPGGMLQALKQGEPLAWGENPPEPFWTRAANPGLDFAGAAAQIESALPPHMPFGALLSIDHTQPATLQPVAMGSRPGQSSAPALFPYRCPPPLSAHSASGASPSPECYRLEFDSAIHTGEYLSAESFRFAATHSPEALARVKQALGGIQQLFWVTGDAAVSKGRIVPVLDKGGLFSRAAIPADAPLPMGDSADGTVPGLGRCYYERPERGWDVEVGSQWQHFASFADIPATVRAQLALSPLGQHIRPAGRVWYGLGCGEGDDSPLSRDQYVGIFMGLAYAHALVPDPGVQQITRDLVTQALAYLIQNNWDVRLAPDRRIALDSNFLRAWDFQIGFLRIGASVNPDAVMPNGATLAQLYQAYAAGSKASWIPMWATALQPVGGGYFAFNLNHAVLGPVLLLEKDPGLRGNYLVEYLMLRRATQTHKNAYFNAVSLLAGATSSSQTSPSNPHMTMQEEMKGILAEWLERRNQVNAGNGLPFNFVGDPSYQAKVFNGGEAVLAPRLDGRPVYVSRYALPVSARIGDGLDFAWQRGAFEMAVAPPAANPRPGCAAQLPMAAGGLSGRPGLPGSNVTAAQIYACGSDHSNQEAPGVDYLLPYWMSAYLGLLK